jgi:hypothetical protein
MLAIIAAVVFGLYLILHLLGVHDSQLFNFETFTLLGLLLLSLYLAGVGSGPVGTGSGSGRRFYGRRPGRG